MEIPSALDMAEDIIKANPDLFVDCLSTQIAIVEGMEKYYEQVRKYCDHLRKLAEISLLINSAFIGNQDFGNLTNN